MNWQFTPYLLPYIITAVIAAALAVFALARRRLAPGATSLGFLMVAVFEWTLTNALELASPNLATKLFWGNLEYLGIVAVPILWLTFVLRYTARDQWITPRNIALLAILPAATLFLVWTNDAHGLMRNNIGLDTSGPFTVVTKTYGLWFWVHTAYSYTLVLLGTFLLIRGLDRSPSLYRSQKITLLIGAVMPWVGNATYIFRLGPVARLDLTPLAFALTGLALAWALFRFQLFNIVPVAREATLESMSDAVIVLDMQNRVVDFNPAAQRVIGRSASQAIGHTAREVFAAWPALVENCRDALQAHVEITLGVDDDVRCYDLRLSPLRDWHGRLIGRLVVGRDITDRKETEQVLRQTRDELEARVGQRTAELARANQELSAEIIQRERNEKEIRQRIEAETIWGTVGKTVIATRDLAEVLKTVIQIINEKMKVETGSILLREPESDELCFAKILRGNEEQFSSIHLRIGQGIAGWVAQTGRAALVNDTAHDPRFYHAVDDQTGFKTRSILCVPLIVKDTVVGVIELLNRQEGIFTQDDLHLLEAIAAPVAIAIRNAQLDLEVQKQLATTTDLLQKVQRAKKEWEHSIDAIEEGISLVDENCKILRVNQTLANWLHASPSELVGQHCYRAVYGQEDKLAYCPNARLGKKPAQPIEWEMEEPRLGGIFRFSTYPLLDPSGKHIGTVNVIKDITVEKQIQAQMIQNQKLAATGRIAASLAHEINNPLQAIQGCLELAQTNVGDPTKQRRYLTMATTELEQLAGIVRQILDFNRPAKGQKASVDVGAVVNDVLALSAKRLQLGKVLIQTQWDANVPMIDAVSNQLQQVFLNLILNAIEAMPQGGRLQIRGQVVILNGNWLTIAFTDSGVGIPPDALDKIFEPFYTTNAEGTGLGLSVCHNLVSGHGGHIAVESAVGRGSTFTVWLPVPAEPSQVKPSD